MPAAASKAYKFVVITADNKYIKSGTATIEAGNYYQTTLTMSPRYPLALSSATAEWDLGAVACDDGYLYMEKKDVPSGKTAVGILGKVTETGHGLILALQDAPSQNWYTINGWPSVTTFADTELKQLPEEAVVFRFLKTGLSDGSYYLMVQGKYLAMQDKDGSLTLVDSISEAGTKWLAEADKAGMAGAVNLRNARLLGGKDAYLRIAEGGFTCDAYSAMESGSFQLRIVAAAEADSAVRAAGDPGYMPVAGDKVVIYNKVGKAVFGQPTGPDQPKPNLLPAAAKLRNDSLSYNDIGDGGLIFKVSISDGYYTFQTGSKYLACSENYVGSDGRTTNDECLILVDAES